jgi:DNA-binding transcriptional ArsR family regulator
MIYSTASRRVTIEDEEQIRCLASPVRQEIVDTLQALGTASAADLAAELGRPADGLYYHLRSLLETGLVVAAGHRGAGRRREAVYALPAGDGLRLAYDPDNVANVEAVTDVVGSMLRVAGRDFEKGFRPGLAVCEGPHRNLWAARLKGWLSETELEEIHELLRRVRRLLDRPRQSGEQRLHCFTLVLAPSPAGATDGPEGADGRS